MMSERNHRDGFISFNRKHTRTVYHVSQTCGSNNRECEMHIKVIASQTTAVQLESKWHMTAVARDTAAGREARQLVPSHPLNPKLVTTLKLKRSLR